MTTQSSKHPPNGAYGCATIAPRGLHVGSPSIGFNTEYGGLYNRQSRVVSSYIEGMVNVKVGSGSMVVACRDYQLDSDRVCLGRATVCWSHCERFCGCRNATELAKRAIFPKIGQDFGLTPNPRHRNLGYLNYSLLGLQGTKENMEAQGCLS